jgi:hypothetical protein
MAIQNGASPHKNGATGRQEWRPRGYGWGVCQRRLRKKVGPSPIHAGQSGWVPGFLVNQDQLPGQVKGFFGGPSFAVAQNRHHFAETLKQFGGNYLSRNGIRLYAGVIPWMFCVIHTMWNNGWL